MGRRCPLTRRKDPYELPPRPDGSRPFCYHHDGGPPKRSDAPTCTRNEESPIAGFRLLDLPSEIISNILSRVPTEWLVRSITVSKIWYQLTTDPHFHILHFKNFTLSQPSSYLFHQYIKNPNPRRKRKRQNGKKGSKPNKSRFIRSFFLGFDENAADIRLKHDFVQGKNKFYIVESCNGLLCLCDKKSIFPIIIYNPLTKETMEIPKLGFMVINDGVVSFGYDAKTNKYKLVLLLTDECSPCNSHAYILTLGENTWRKLHQPLHQFNLDTPSVFFNGEFNWIIVQDSDIQGKKRTRHILCLDISDERFNLIGFIDGHQHKIWNYYNLVKYGNCLALTVFNFRKQSIKIWALKDKQRGQWIYKTRDDRFSLISSRCSCSLHKFIMDSSVGDDSLLLSLADPQYEEALEEWVLYTPISGQCIHFEARTHFHVTSFVPSLVSLKF